MSKALQDVISDKTLFVNAKTGREKTQDLRVKVL